jgi:hypothetical protein
MDRKAFKFYRSYWEIAQQLNDSERLQFYDALLKRQFTGEESTLTGLANFAYISQRHSIDLQIDGYLAQSQKKNPIKDPMQGGAQGGTQAPSIQEKEKEKEKGIINTSEFERFWSAFDKKVDRKKCSDIWAKIPVTKRNQIIEAANQYRISTPEARYRKNPLTWLRGECWNDEPIINLNTQSNEQFNELTKSIREQYPNV